MADDLEGTRQLEVLKLLAEGKYRKEVAASLGLHLSTVNTYCDRLYARFQVHSAIAAYRKYLSLKHPSLQLP